jgi:hypothetical protein
VTRAELPLDAAYGRAGEGGDCRHGAAHGAQTAAAVALPAPETVPAAVLTSLETG